MRKFDTAYKALQAENAGLKEQVNSSKESIKHRLEVSQQIQELEELRRTVENIPPEILQTYTQKLVYVEEVDKKNAHDR